MDGNQTLRALDSACRNWGSFQLLGHGIDPATIRGLFREMQAFFAQPRRKKLAIVRTRENPWGYYDRERTANRIDCKQVFDFGPATGGLARPQWPDQPGFRQSVQDYYRACERLSFRLLDAIASNLGAKPGLLRQGFAPSHSSFLRLNYYPGQPSLVRDTLEPVRDDRGMGVHAHTDAGVLTLLCVDANPGLQIWHDRQWVSVDPREDALLVNLGDIVQVWSNDRYCAPLHRVVTPAGAERYSAPFFLNPAYRANYAPLDCAVDSAHPARYRSINWGEFREQRSLGDYADHGEEIQLKHYRLHEETGT
jgi:isopenicillin N synthase-like dioxygenase